MPYVLFSPIGGTDPISYNARSQQYTDGSMLHILRHYRPEAVLLYLSREMLEYERRDHRYTACIRLLAEREGFSCEILPPVERPELEEVQKFDCFLEEFRPLVDRLHQQFPKHELLLNLSSGTPAMKSALAVLSCLLPYPVRPVQVSTPVKELNSKDKVERTYDTELAWDLDLDNQPGQEDRTDQVAQPNFLALMGKQNIKSHLQAYDYEAAFTIAKGISGFLPTRVLQLLRAARSRTQLNWPDIPEELRRALRLETGSRQRTDLSEYLLWLQMKQKRGDLSDFLRGLTPGLFALERMIVEELCGLQISDYCDARGRLSRESLERDDTGRGYLRLLEENGRAFEDGFLQTSHYTGIIQNRFGERAWSRPLSDLRKLEGDVRNRVAHTVTQVDEAWLQNQGKNGRRGKSSGEILALLQKAVEAVNADSQFGPGEALPIRWDSYDEMNQKILEAMG